MRKTPSRCARRCATGSPPAAARLSATWTTDRCSSTPACAGRARYSGIKLTHSQPGKPAGRGKIERFFRTVRDQFLVEITGGAGGGGGEGAEGAGTVVGGLAELNALFTAWVSQVYHPRVHSETQMAPLARFLAPGPPAPTPAELLREAFRWAQWRTVTKTATVSLHGN